MSRRNNEDGWALEQAHSGHTARISQTHVFRYGIALAFVGAALSLSLLLRPLLPDGFLIFFLSAVMLAGWFGRTGAGVLAVIVSMVTVDYYFIAPYRAFVVEVDELPYLLAFLFSAVVTSWLGSARRAAEEKQKAHLDELFEQTPEAIILVDLQDRVLRVNKEFTHIFGYRIDEILNRPSVDLITPIELRADAMKNRERLADGQHINVETIRKRKDGSCLNVSEVSFPVIANGKCIGYYAIFRDITEGKRALERLQKAQAELAHLSRITTMGELAASIAHEINQPIGAIVTNGNAAVRWLRQTPPYTNEAEETLECIVRDANRAAQVIGRIRSLLRKTPSVMVRLDVNEVIREVLTLTSYETGRRGAFVLTELAGGLPMIFGDRIQLQQVLLNLIMNSFDAMSGISDRPRHVMVKSSVHSDSVLVQVRDTGSGWEDQHAAVIFDPFFTTKKDGIGMGLTISRSIIENHGGSLWAERGIPHGATLKFTLPIATKSE
ncbi:MAG TPA: PAS domain S-box protein [Terriglobia bacterium]|nr:PAS domain S-box protein [Terriglobia bacterium]